MIVKEKGGTLKEKKKRSNTEDVIGRRFVTNKDIYTDCDATVK